MFGGESIAQLYPEEFISEAKAKFGELEALMRQLREGANSGEESRALVERMLREAHTIKGLASLAGFSTLNKAAHWLETLLGLALDGTLELTGGFLDVVEDFVSVIGSILSSIEESGEEGKVDLSNLTAKIALLKKPQGSAPVFSPLKGRSSRVYRVKVTFDRVPGEIPAWLFSVISRLHGVGEIIEYPKDVDDVLRGLKNPPESFDFKIRTPVDPSKLRDLLMGSDGVRNVEVTGGEEKTPVLVRVHLKEETPLKAARALLILGDLKGLGKVISVNPPEKDLKNGILLDGRAFEVLIETSGDLQRVKDAISAHTGVADVEITKDFEKKTSGSKGEHLRAEKTPEGLEIPAARIGGPVKVSPEMLDRLLGVAEELLLLRDWMKEVANPEELRGISARLDESLSELRKTLLEIRTVSVKSTLEPLVPAVGRLAGELGKEVEVVVEGEDVKVDRGVLGVLLEALVHILKNAVVHGIEPPEERIRKGKARKGTVRVLISQRSEYVEVAVSDDGRGIDLETIRRRAVEKGLVSREKAENLSDEEALNLLFLPGISGESRVSRHAGRGMGLNIVWEAVRRVNGSIVVDTEKDAGTTFILRVPFEVSVLFAYLLNVGGNLYALPSPGVVGEVKVDKSLVRKVGDGYITAIGGEVLPALMLHDLVDFTAFPGEKLAGVILDTGKGKVLLLADGVEGKREIVVKPLRGILPPAFSGGGVYSGVTILGGGRVVPVIDPLRILEVLGYGVGRKP
ncbi:ATP-binding protein [Thermococcus zilligii]|uniref:ATP-binding protein n=1 Tax=Thermococcus zilligii TaxID=54076 RepID=UPI00029AF3FB|nr:ATP-binding protein [Thermococcus zilligii]